MTDITELAQSLKAAAEKWQEAWGKYDKVEITIAEFIRAANQYESIVKDPANVIALVEALEEAQQRIAELESRTVKLSANDIFNVPEGRNYVGGEMVCVDIIRDYLEECGIKVEAE
ncbi:hypothetical protein [Klebsiella quasipneumoniae]|uniref:hypothetical protein n=1 Tax=Klebsiella quasipneumoniae TaxID=1463165 RepID=UPI002ABB5D0E|nr:hypothetical protein [Klebsiella quasipneumoniae]MDZ3080721.1 hypothetical protein [Klebsiella quasipneumoniae]